MYLITLTTEFFGIFAGDPNRYGAIQNAAAVDQYRKACVLIPVAEFGKLMRRDTCPGGK